MYDFIKIMEFHFDDSSFYLYIMHLHRPVCSLYLTLPLVCSDLLHLYKFMIPLANPI